MGPLNLIDVSLAECKTCMLDVLHWTTTFTVSLVIVDFRSVQTDALCPGHLSNMYNQFHEGVCTSI